MNPEVAGDGLHRPALGVQRDHGPPALGGPVDLVVGRKAPDEAQWGGFLGEHALDGLPRGPPAEADVAGVRDLVGVEARILGLEVHDESTQGGGQPLAPGVLGAEEALHPLRVEARYPALQRAFAGRTRRTGAFGRGAAEEHQRADELVVALLGPAAKELDLLPFVGQPTWRLRPFSCIPVPLATPSRGGLWWRRGERSMPQGRVLRQPGLADGLADRLSPAMGRALCG